MSYSPSSAPDSVQGASEAAAVSAASASSAAQQQNGDKAYVGGLDASPSPSPALSAYSYSTTSTDSDLDLHSLSLDNWGRGYGDKPESSAGANQNWPGTSCSGGAVLSDAYLRRPKAEGASCSGGSILSDECMGRPASGSASQTGSSAGHRQYASSNGCDMASGTATPVPGSGSSASAAFDRRALKRLANVRRESSDTTKPLSRSDKDGSEEEEGTLAEKVQDEAKIEDDDDDDNEAEMTGFDVEDEDEDDMHANGVPAARGWRLDARKAKTHAFRATVLSMFSAQLQLDTWSESTCHPHFLPLTPDKVKLKRISGAFSNAVFFVSYETEGSAERGPRTVLLRIYGSGTEVLLSRRAELLILHTLSSLYEIGPHILGTFANGRVETFFDAEPIGKEGMRDLGDRRESIKEDGSLLVRGTEGRAQWTARRMRQLHEVPLETMRQVLEQGDLRSGNDGSSVFGRGIENHLFARSHRPRTHRGSSQQPQVLDASRAVRDSPAPMTEAEDQAGTSLSACAADGVNTQAMAMRGISPHRSGSVASIASFDSLATSCNSIDGLSTASMSTDSLASPAMGPSSFNDSQAYGARRTGRQPLSSTAGFPFASGSRRSSTSSGTQFRSHQPYPGMWRRSKRWAREAGKVFALVDEFCQTPAGTAAYQQALRGTILEGRKISPFASEPLPRAHSTELGSTIGSLANTLLAIAAIDFPRLLQEMDAFKKFVRKWEKRYGPSRRVLAHGDTQYSNLLLIKESSLDDEWAGKGMPRPRSRDSTRPEAGSRTNSASSSGTLPRQDATGQSLQQAAGSARTRMRRMAPYERLVVIDFEYCSPNPRAYDIANAFHEWRFDYHHPTDSWSPRCQPYPTRDERRRWLRAYVEQGRLLRMRGKTSKAVLDSPASTATMGSPALPDDLSLPPPAIVPSSRDEEQANGTTPKKAGAQPFTSSHGSSTPGSAGSSIASSAKSDASSAGLSSAAVGGSKNSSTTSVVQSTASPATYTAAYTGVDASPMLSGRSTLAYLEASMEREIERLEREVEVYSPACHASWALWGVTFAKEMMETLLARSIEDLHASPKNEGNVSAADPGAGWSAESFDNLRYSLSRVELFREEIAALGVRI